MSNDENHGQAHMTLTAREISGVFATFFFYFAPPTDFISHYCCGGHYMLCSIDDSFFLK